MGKFTAIRAPRTSAAKSRASARSTASGFSHSTARPAASPARAWDRWVAGGEAM